MQNPKAEEDRLYTCLERLVEGVLLKLTWTPSKTTTIGFNTYINTSEDKLLNINREHEDYYTIRLQNPREDVMHQS